MFCWLLASLLPLLCLGQNGPLPIPSLVKEEGTTSQNGMPPSPTFPSFESSDSSTTGWSDYSPNFYSTSTTDPLPSETESPGTRTASYWISFSSTIRPGTPLSIQIQLFKGSSPVPVKFELINNERVSVSSLDAIITPLVAQTVELEIPKDLILPVDRPWHYFTVTVKAKSDDLYIMKSNRVKLTTKAFSIFVQTDKALYKPSQTVLFRTLAMTHEMKVMSDVKQDIMIMDPKGNKIAHFKEVEAPKHMGVVQKSLRLADNVPIGEWIIRVTINGREEDKIFEVADYVLPKFEAIIDAPTFGLTGDKYYSFTVSGKYTFGKPLTEGSVDIKVTEPNDYIFLQDSNRQRAIRQRGKLDKNGVLKVKIPTSDFSKLIQFSPDYKTPLSYRQFEITADVYEPRTNKKHSTTHLLTMHDSPIEMEFLPITPDSFKSGMNFTAYLEVRKLDKTKFDQGEMKVMFSATIRTPEKLKRIPTPAPSKPIFSSQRSSVPGQLEPFMDIDALDPYYPPRMDSKTLKLDPDTYSVPETGWVVINITVPEDAQSINIVATTVSKYKEERAYTDAFKFHSPSNSFLQLKADDQKPKIGDKLRVHAHATAEMNELVFQVYSKKSLIMSDIVKDDGGPSNYLSFEFDVLQSMAPSMSIVAFYFKDGTEVVADALSLSVEGMFDNSVSISFSKEKVKPGEKVNVTVRGEEDSIVFLLSVDKSVKLLKSGNDITQDMLRTTLAYYEGGNPFHWRYMFVCGWPSYFEGKDASSLMNSAGINFITDGILYNYKSNNDDYNDRIPEGNPDPSEELNTATGSKNPSVDENFNKNDAALSPKTRKYFPENWLWKITMIMPDSDGEVTIPLVAPDTITSWVASVFSANQKSGLLSVAAEPAEVITFRDLFISLDLPSSIVRNESFCFPATMFSYYKQEIPIMLTLEQSDDFSIIWAKDEKGKIIPQTEKLHFSYFMGFMEENDIKTVTFCFTPEKLGLIPIRVVAMTDVDGLSDKVERMLQVKPEGVPRATSLPQLVSLTNGEWRQDVSMAFPDDTVEGSQSVYVNIAGNLLGSIFDNLDDLLKKPYGCGEQNMINFSPIMSLLDFFFTTNSITDEFKEKAVDYMGIGYQKEILYEHGTTGGYSTFGNNDNTKENPSTWLTAFVIKCFSKAAQLEDRYKDVLAIDHLLIKRSTKWMVAQQSRNGEFIERGRVFNKNLQGGSSANGVSLTAYNLIALQNALQIEWDDRHYSVVKGGLLRGQSFLEERIDTMTDPYDICITAYALHSVNSYAKDKIFEKLKNIATKGDGMVYWERPAEEKTKEVYYWSQKTDAINIEMTAYALLTYSLRGVGTSDGLPIVRWLSQQTGPNGGFISTQDTVIGIEALTSVAKDLFGTEFVPMQISVANGKDSPTVFNLTKDNEMLLQRKRIPFENKGKIELKAVSAGNVEDTKSPVLVDVVFKYNVLSETKPVVYQALHSILTNPDNGFVMEVNIWTLDGKPAGMTILEVQIPAGYSPDFERIKSEEVNPHIKTADVTDGNLNIYVQTDVINEKPIAIVVAMTRGDGVLINSKPKKYRVYNYYESDIELTKEYHLKESQNFCSSVPEFGICQFQPLPIITDFVAEMEVAK